MCIFFLIKHGNIDSNIYEYILIHVRIVALSLIGTPMEGVTLVPGVPQVNIHMYVTHARGTCGEVSYSRRAVYDQAKCDAGCLANLRAELVP